MIPLEEVKKYLPQYLSDESHGALLEGLKNFPNNIDKRLYSAHLSAKEELFQGDCIKCLPQFIVAEGRVKEVPAMIISNTCDNSFNNARRLPLYLNYAPIVKMSKLVSLLKENLIPEVSIKDMVDSIRKQKTSHLFYLPVGQGIEEESIVFFDKINSCENIFEKEDIVDQRFCCLSNYGFYLFLFKLSIHFTRIGEKVDRDIGQVL